MPKPKPPAGKHLAKTKAKSVNAELEQLAGIQQRAAELEKEAAVTKDLIRKGIRSMVVVFVDMVGSTQFKLDHLKEPDVWILRVKQFGEVVAEYVQQLGGRVVKYIGDEVMAVFDSESCVNDSLGLVLRVDEMEKVLKEVIGIETRIKVAVDFGEVYFLEYSGHEESDPQGTAVDRCARISKFSQPGTVVCSFEFAREVDGRVVFSKVGTAKMKGLGEIAVYQLGNPTIAVESKVEVSEADWTKVNADVERLTLEKSRLEQMNRNLETKLEEAKVEADPEDLVRTKEEDDVSWGDVERKIAELKQFVSSVGVPRRDYARFLFLFRRGEGQTYDKMEGRAFDECIEKDLVVQRDAEYVLNEANRRNQKAIEIMDELARLLEQFEPDEDELFDYSLSDAEFWAAVIKIAVV